MSNAECFGSDTQERWEGKGEHLQIVMVRAAGEAGNREES